MEFKKTTLIQSACKKVQPKNLWLLFCLIETIQKVKCISCWNAEHLGRRYPPSACMGAQTRTWLVALWLTGERVMASIQRREHIYQFSKMSIPKHNFLCPLTLLKILISIFFLSPFQTGTLWRDTVSVGQWTRSRIQHTACMNLRDLW